MAESEIEQIQKAIDALEKQRALLGDAVVDTAVAPLHEKLAALEATERPDQQRKLVTTLFLDVVNSTAIVRDMDPEDHLAIMDGAMQRLTVPVEANGGRVLKYLGDGLMALFGHPVARENEPELAVRTALQMLAAAHDYAREVEDRWGVADFAVRIGMSTGMAIIGGGTEGENTVAGRHVNLAARLETAALPGGLFISHSTYQQVRGLFDIEQQEPITAKGFAKPQAAYLVLRARPRRFSQTLRGIEGVATRMIGRDAELTRLKESYTAVVEQGDGRLITIVGEAGIGKSRLLSEFGGWLEARAHEVRIIQGKAHPQMQGSPYGLLRDLFTVEFNIQEDDSVNNVRRKFEEGFAQQLGSVKEALPKAHLVGQLLGFDFSDSPFLDEALDDPRRLRERALTFISEYVVTAAHSHPVVILLEDLHWADNSSLDALDDLISGQSSLPVLIVAIARPALFRRFPAWGSAYAFHQLVDLGPLTGEDGRILVEEMLRKLNNLPDALRDLIVDNAEGNPFYVEELIKMLIEEGVIIKSDPYWQVHDQRISEVAVPPSLTGVIQARLDRLDPQDKTVVQQASVIGRTFWDDAVAYLFGAADIEHARGPVAGSLDVLRERELVFPQPKSRFAGTVERLFKHALLRDVAYETVLKRLRREYHGLAADWLIQNSRDRQVESADLPAVTAGLIADHLVEAGREAEAVHYLAGAAKSAIASFANEEAIGYLQTAVDLFEKLPETAKRSEQELDLLILLGRLYSATKGLGSDEVLQTFKQAQALASIGGTPRQQFAVLNGQYMTYAGRGQWDQALVVGEQLLAMGQASGNATLLLWAHYTLGMINCWRGDLNVSRGHLEELLALYDPGRHATQFRRVFADPRLTALGALSLLNWMAGYAGQGRAVSQRALREAEAMDHPITAVDAWFFAAMYEQFGGNARKAHDFAEAAVSLAAKEKTPDYWAWSAAVQGWGRVRLGEVEDGIDRLQSALDSLNHSGTKYCYSYFLYLMADAYRIGGKPNRGLGTVEEAMAFADSSNERLFSAELNRLKGDLLLDLGASTEEAEESYQQALSIARKRAYRSHELRAALRLAHLWKGQGKQQDAYALLSGIYNWFTEGFDTADLREARSLLEELS